MDVAEPNYSITTILGSPGDINCGGDGPQADDVRNLWKSYCEYWIIMIITIGTIIVIITIEELIIIK